MRACIFVDGENFRYSIADLFEKSPYSFEKKDYLPNAKWGELFDHMVKEGARDNASRLRTYWYVIGEVDFRPRLPSSRDIKADPKMPGRWIKKHQHHLQKNCYLQKNHDLQKMSDEDIIAVLRKGQERIASQFRGYREIHRGIMHRNNAIEFKYSGAISHNPIANQLGKEKTVDINLAVDMVELRDNYDIAIIVSGDQDYLPAVQAVKNAGKTVVNVAFTKSGKLLPGGAKRLNETTDWSLEMDYDTVAEYMFPSLAAT